MSTMEELTNLQNKVAEQKIEDAEANVDNFGTTEKEELTDAEKETLKELEAKYGEKPILVVNDTDANGNTTQIPAKDYIKSLDKKTTPVTTEEASDQMDKLIKTVNSGDIKKNMDNLKEEARTRTLEAFRTLAVANDKNKSLSDDDIIALNTKALKSLQDYFQMDRLNADELTKNLRKMPLDKICEILPEDFWSVYITNNEMKLRNPGAKDRLIATIAYLTTTGPEFDYLNEYIEEENKLMMVSKRLMECQVQFSEMLKDEKMISELVSETYRYVPEDTSIWAKEIKMPNRVHNEFAQRYVIYDHYKKAYEELMKEYPITEDATEADARFISRARAIIQQEIDECDQKMEVYLSVCNLDLFKELLQILIDRFKVNKKINMKYLTMEAERAIESIKRCKQNLPFPGFKGTERRVEQLLANYLVAFPIAIRKYNEAVDKVKSREDATDENTKDISKITIPGYEDNDTFMIYALLMVIMMGRILKKCTRNDATKYDAIILDAYFFIFNRMGTDLYLMNDVWKLMYNLTGYTLQTWYIPEKNAQKKKPGGGNK